MKSVFRKFMALIFFFSILCTAGAAYAADRWVYMGKEEGMEGYYDTQTARYDRSGNAVTYWFRWTTDGKPSSLDYITVDLSTKEYSMPKYAVYQKYGNPKIYTNTAGYVSPVPPDSTIEKTVDAICDAYRVPHMYPNKEHRWTWIYSDDRKDIYLANDAYSVNGIDSKVTVWIKETYLSGWTGVFRCIVDLDGQTIEEHTKGVATVAVLPDTMEEAIYNKAKEMAGK